MVINNWKNVHEISDIEFFLGSNLNFTIKVFTWVLADDHGICKKKKKRKKRITIKVFTWGLADDHGICKKKKKKKKKKNLQNISFCLISSIIQ